MLKQAMFGVVFGFAVVPAMASANISQSARFPLSTGKPVALKISGKFDGNRISMVGDGNVGPYHALVDSVCIGKNCVTVMGTFVTGNLMNLHISVIDNGHAIQSSKIVSLTKHGKIKMPNGFFCQTTNPK